MSLRFWSFKSISRAVTIKPQQGPWSVIHMTMLQFSSHKNIEVTKPATIHQLLILRLIKKLFPPNKKEVAENLDSVVGLQELDSSVMPWCEPSLCSYHSRHYQPCWGDLPLTAHPQKPPWPTGSSQGRKKLNRVLGSRTAKCCYGNPISLMHLWLTSFGVSWYFRWSHTPSGFKRIA